MIDNNGLFKNILLYTRYIFYFFFLESCTDIPLYSLCKNARECLHHSLSIEFHRETKDEKRAFLIVLLFKL